MRLSFGEYLFGINLFLTFLLCSLGGIFSSQQSNLALMIATGLLFLRAMGERERLVSLNGDSRDKVTQSKRFADQSIASFGYVQRKPCLKQ